MAPRTEGSVQAGWSVAPIVRAALLALIAVATVGCRNQDGEVAFLASKTTAVVQGRQVALGPEAKPQLASMRQAGWRFFAAATEGADGNVSVSPLGFTMCLALLANGLDGPSREAVERAAGITPGSTKAYNEAAAALLTQVEKGDAPPVSIANGVWMVWPSPVRPEYEQAVREAYRAKVVNLGSAGRESVEQVNAWCAKQTRGRIRALLARLDPAATVLFTNALAFDLAWPEDFAAPKPAPFKAPSGVRNVPTVSGERTYMGAEVDGFQAAWIPCKGGSVALVLPPKGLGLEAFRKGSPNGLFDRLERSVKRCRGRLSFPVVDLSNDHDLMPALGRLVGPEALGRLDLRFVSHDLSEDNFVASATQKVVFELDEKGARGAAATALEAAKGASAEPKKRDFAADRPFLVVVTERQTGAVLLAAWVAEP